MSKSSSLGANLFFTKEDKKSVARGSYLAAGTSAVGRFSCGRKIGALWPVFSNTCFGTRRGVCPNRGKARFFSRRRDSWESRGQKVGVRGRRASPSSGELGYGHSVSFGHG